MRFPGRLIAASTLLCACTGISGQVMNELWLKESVIQSRVPKKLRTFSPFWGVPEKLSGEPEPTVSSETAVAARKDSVSVPGWICWNLDLVSIGHERYKMEEFFPEGYSPASISLIRKAVDECYRWAWRKPYGMTCVTVGPLPGMGGDPAAWFVAVCKKEPTSRHFSLGFTSLAFVIPESGGSKDGIYQYSEPVNVLEYKCGYNLFPGLPQSVQEAVEGMTTYELFCPFQELEEYVIEQMQVEAENETETIERIIE